MDLGLSVKWASVNVVATSEKDLGKYYGWGEVSDKAEGVYYNWDSYEVFKGVGTDDASRDAALSAIYDDKLILKKEKDVAHVQWGGSWRMPTEADFEELLQNCTWVMEPSDYELWTADTPGGWRVTSKINGSSIFIPAAGQRTNDNLEKEKGREAYFWTSNRDEDGDTFAIIFGRFMNQAVRGYQYVCIGNPVRPVYDEK